MQVVIDKLYTLISRITCTIYTFTHTNAHMFKIGVDTEHNHAHTYYVHACISVVHSECTCSQKLLLSTTKPGYHMDG